MSNQTELLDQIAAEMTTAEPKATRTIAKAKANVKASIAKATTVSPKAKGFKTASIAPSLLAQAKQWHATYQRGIGSKGYPMVGFSASSPNFYPMVVVATVPGFTSEVDALAKVQAVQTVLGAKLATRPLGLGAFGSPSVPTRYGTARQVGLALILATDAKGVRKMRPTTPRERQAYLAIMPEAQRGSPKASAKGKTKVSAKATAERRNGNVTVSVDKALRSSAKAAERATTRKANRAKQAAQGAPAAS